MKKQPGELFTLIVVLIGVFGLRLMVALGPLESNAIVPFEPDSYDYVRLAGCIAESGSYGTMEVPELNRAPGYPVFLAAVKAVAPGFFLKATLVLQCLVDVGSCLLLWLILRLRLGVGATAAMFGLLLQALSAAALSSDGKLLSESLFTFLLLGSLWFATPPLLGDDDFKRNSRNLFFAGTLWAFACLTRVALLPLTPLLALSVCVLPRRLFPALTFLAPVILLVGGWTLRNEIVAGYWGVSTVSSINLYRYDACAIESSLSGRPFAVVQSEFDLRIPAGEGQAEIGAFCHSEGIKIIRAHPLEFLKVHLKGMVISLLPAEGDLFKSFGADVGGNGALSVIMSKGFVEGIRHYLNGNWWVLAIAAPSLALLLLKYALAMAWMSKGRGQWLFLGALSLCVLWFLFAGGAASTPRFRVPAEPLLAILAAVALSYFEGRLPSWLIPKDDDRSNRP